MTQKVKCGELPGSSAELQNAIQADVDALTAAGSTDITVSLSGGPGRWFYCISYQGL